MTDEKPKQTNRDKFITNLNERFVKTTTAYGFSKTKQKQLDKLLVKVIAVLDAHNVYKGETWMPDEPLINCGLPTISSNCLTTQGIVDRIIEPEFTLQDFIKELLQFEVATVGAYVSDGELKSVHGSVLVTFKNGTGYITNEELDKRNRQYMEAAGLW